MVRPSGGGVPCNGKYPVKSSNDNILPDPHISKENKLSNYLIWRLFLYNRQYLFTTKIFSLPLDQYEQTIVTFYYDISSLAEYYYQIEWVVQYKMAGGTRS